MLEKSNMVKGEDFYTTFFNESGSLLYQSDTNMPGVDIGFDFKFNGQTYDKFVASGIGYIMLGEKGEQNVTISGTPFQLTRISYPRIGIGVDNTVYGVDGTKIVYKREGTPPSQVLTVEFSGLAYVEDASGDGLFNYQIKLYESDNHVEMIFDKFTIPGDNIGYTDQMCIGLSGEGNPNRAHYRIVEDKNWCITTQSYNNQGSRNVGGSYFKEGLKYMFSLPPECEAPTEKVTALSLVPYSDKIAIDVDIDSTGHAEGYLIVGSTKPITENPDGQIWQSAGMEALGGTVVAVGALSDLSNPNSPTHLSFTHEGLEPNTTYYYAAYLYNHACTNPKYTTAFVQQTSTRTSSVSAFELDSLKLDEVSFSVEANDLDEEVVIVMTESHGYRLVGMASGNPVYQGNFGLIDSDIKAGDTYKAPIEKTKGNFPDTAINTVLYAGSATDHISCPLQLKENHIYYFGATSRDAEGVSSSLWENIAVLSPVSIPFEDRFENMLSSEENPFIGWNGTTGFKMQYGESSAIASFTRSFGEKQEACLTLPPMDFPVDSNVFFGLNYTLDPWYMEFTEQDSIIFEISTDGGKSFSGIEAIHYQSNEKEIPGVIVRGYPGLKQGVLRLRIVSYNETAWDCIVDSVYVIGVTCDVPRNLQIIKDSTLGSKVLVDWDASEDNEQEWHLSYAIQLTDGNYGDWSEPELLNDTKHWLNGLGNDKTYKARVRSVCNPGNTGRWTEAEFRSGRIPSFYEDFDDLQFGTGAYYGGIFGEYVNAPYFFSESYAEINEDGIYSPYYRFDDIDALEWKSGAMPYEGWSDFALAWEMNTLSGIEVLGLPTVWLQEEDSSYLTFKMAYGTVDEEDAYEKVDEPSDGYKVELWISTDGGRSYQAGTPLRTWDAEQLVSMEGITPVTVDLSSYEGAVSFAFAFYGDFMGEERRVLWMDSIGIVNACPTARHLKVDYLADSSARITWIADQTVDKWIVKLESAQGEKLYESPEGSFLFTELLPQTKYTASVSHLCNASDTAAWRSIAFTTGGGRCEPVTDVVVADVGANSANISWIGEAAWYRLRIRPVSEESGEWTIYQVYGNQYGFSTLKSETEYVGGIQAVYSVAVGDTSEYVNFEPFFTRVVTCQAPYNLLVEGTPTHNEASFTWAGEAGDYQLEWRLRNQNSILGRKMVHGNAGTIEGLNAETLYEARVRAVCAAGDTSAWSEERYFETTEAPGCPVPTDLKVESLTATSATLLWSVDEVDGREVASFILRHRASNVQAWDSVRNIEDMSYEMTGLEPKTAYVWSVLSACADGTYSGWGTQTRFETTGTASEAAEESGLFLTASRHQIHVMNPGAVQIERIRVYDLSGAMAEDYVIRDNGNVILATGLSMQVAIVEVLAADGSAFRFKVLLP